MLSVALNIFIKYNMRNCNQFVPIPKICVRRSNLIEDALNSFLNENWGLKSPIASFLTQSRLVVEFLGEVGVDSGGLRREFFSLLVDELLNCEYGLFKLCSRDTAYWLTGYELGFAIQTELIGFVIGLALLNGDTLKVPFPKVFFRKLLSSNRNLLKSTIFKNYQSSSEQYIMFKPVTSTNFIVLKVMEKDQLILRSNYNPDLTKFIYLRQIDKVYKSLTQLPEYTPTLQDLEEIEPEIADNIYKLYLMSCDSNIANLNLTFSVTKDCLGEFQEIPLKDKNGNEYSMEKLVTNQNVLEYIEALLNYYLIYNIETQFDNFYLGFHRACACSLFMHLTPEQLAFTLNGIEGEIDVNHLEKVTQYLNGYDEHSQVIKWFWVCFRMLSSSDKKKLLMFITGSERIPLGGPEALELKITNPGGSSDRLPWAHTCEKILLLPNYPSYELLSDKLRIAIEHNRGFGLY
uniref:HECT-type E3 ubiquitin transferase n=1 Tax=Dermatophagoides pteronyssinus TaxID=6956 RepID=A0A6P6YBQ0_DERPT|nr:probable E3 ubiquitin-protein ligase HECTD2 [Dermatophagoides pteronyssinus]